MAKCFEDELMDIQHELISLCLEFITSKIDKLYVYCSLENKSSMFNIFIKKDGIIMTLNRLCIDTMDIMEFLQVGTEDLDKIKKLCCHYERKIPTEIKMIYDISSDNLDIDYKYEEICSAKTGVSSADIFINWYNETKEKE